MSGQGEFYGRMKILFGESIGDFYCTVHCTCKPNMNSA